MRVMLQFATVLVGVAVIAGCDMCGNEISQEVTSPSGRIKAVAFSRDCGATTGFSTQLSIIPATDTLPKDGGNTLILDGSVPLHVQWHSDSSLHLTGLGSAEAFKQEGTVAGVSVSYGN